METSITSLRRVVKDGDALGSLPDLEADCQRKPIPNLKGINLQETFVVYSEDQVNIYLVNSQERFAVYSEDRADFYPIHSTPAHDPAVHISFSFQEFLEIETVLSSNPLPLT